MAEPSANSGDPDQTPHSVASDLDLHCLPITHLGVFRLKCVTVIIQCAGYLNTLDELYILFLYRKSILKCIANWSTNVTNPPSVVVPRTASNGMISAIVRQN